MEQINSSQYVSKETFAPIKHKILKSRVAEVSKQHRTGKIFKNNKEQFTMTAGSSDAGKYFKQNMSVE